MGSMERSDSETCFNSCFKNTEEHNVIAWTPLQIDTTQVTL